jgi:prolipoprotein diacylglyceryltransferase
MNNLLKAIILFIGIALSNTIIFIVFISESKLPGGEVGVAPFLMMIESLIAIIVSTLIYFFLRKKLKLNFVKRVFIYQIIYVLTLLFLEPNPINNDLSDPFKTLNQFTYIISFIVMSAFMIIAKTVDRLKKDHV